MKTLANRWIVSLGWMTVMALVWVLVVPAHLSGVMFALIVVAGLIVLFFVSALVANNQAPQSVGAILANLESDATIPPSDRNG